MAIPELEFDEASHTYTLEGRKMPSVTQIVRAVFPGWNAGEWYQQRGKAMHHACRLLDEGRLDWATVDPRIEQRVRAWMRFKDEAGRLVTRLCEQPLAARQYQFAGTPDRVYDDHTIIDLKSTIEPQVRVQLGGYSLLYRHNSDVRFKTNAIAVELRDDGDFRVLVIGHAEMMRCEQTFLAALTVYNFCQNYKMKGVQ